MPESEISALKSVIGTSKDIPNVEIVNWPGGKEPGTRDDLYRIFQHVEPNFKDIDESYVLFLDEDKQAGSNKYHILRAKQVVIPDNFGQRDSVVDVVSFTEKERALEFWDIIWNPFGRGHRTVMVSSARVNPILFNHPPGNGASFKHGAFSDMIPNPDKVVFQPRNHGLQLPVFVLEEMSSRDIQTTRSYILSHELDYPVLYDISKRIPSPDMQGMMAYFESEEFLKTDQEPPSEFIAVDRTTLSLAKQDGPYGEVDETDAMIIASEEPLRLQIQDDQDEIYAHICLGYAYGRQDPEEANSTWCNVSISNMYFTECVENVSWVRWASVQDYTDENHLLEEIGELRDSRLVVAGAYYSGKDKFVEPELLNEFTPYKSRFPV